MVAWWWLIIAFFIGEAVGITAMAICIGSADKKEEREKDFLIRQGLIYPDGYPGNGRQKETADAATPTEERLDNE